VKISTRSRYGLRALLELALHYGEGPLMMQRIADSQGVSRKYLDSIFASLKTGGLVRSRRGVGGGHLLAKDPTTIKLGDIMRALEGPLSLVDCVGDSKLCDRSHRCVTRDVWSDVGAAIDKVLDNITLADLIVKYRDKNDAADAKQGCVLNGEEVRDEGETDEAATKPA
jgi:Rrf2 family transcriptional regulator, cysteine metabolism repressor